MSKRILTMVLMASSTSFIMLMSSCDEPCRTITTEGRYWVDSLFVPDSVAVYDTLKVGLVSRRYCTPVVTRTDTVYGNLQLDITVVGPFERMTGDCGPRPAIPCEVVPVGLNFAFVTREHGTLKIVVFEPSGPSLIDSVRVY